MPGRAVDRSPSPALGRSQRGAAVLMALFIAALATIIVSGLFWRQFVVIRTIENQEVHAQSDQLLRGALDWGGAILREDARTTAIDTLQEPWAQPLAETRLDQLGETSALASQASLSGSIEDAQARLNLRNLIGANGQPIQREVDALRRLATELGAPEQTADLIADRMAQAWQPYAAAVAAATGGAGSNATTATGSFGNLAQATTGIGTTTGSTTSSASPGVSGPTGLASGAPGGTATTTGATGTTSTSSAGSGGPAPIPLVRAEDLAGIPGIDPDAAAHLAPYIIVLDVATPVNFNTAPPEVIAARINGLSLTDAKELAAQRDQIPFANTGDILNRLHGRGTDVQAASDFSVASRYFIVRGSVRLERATTRMEALVRRAPAGQIGPVDTLWSREL